MFDVTKLTVCSEKTVTLEHTTIMASNKSKPTNGDIMKFLDGIVSRLDHMDKEVECTGRTQSTSYSVWQRS